MAVLFHYTPSDGAKAIQASKKLKKSDNQIGDAVFGNGVYFTSKSPWNHSKVDIIINNWGVDRKQAEKIAQQGRVNYVVLVYIKMREKRYLWLLVSSRGLVVKAEDS
jgi:hypothetical protein